MYGNTVRSKQEALSTDAARQEKINYMKVYSEGGTNTDGASTTQGTTQGAAEAAPVATYADANTDTATTTQATPTVTYADAYEAWLKGLESRYQTIYDDAEKAAAQKKSDAYADADIARERGVVDAHSAAAQNKATYGANAEQLGSMGLTTSGYSDYINAKAYATERAEVQSLGAQAAYTKRLADQEYDQAVADAKATYEQNMISAEGTLAQYRQEKADEQKANYQSLLAGIENGTVTTDNIGLYAQAYGISDTGTINNLTNYATTYAENQSEQTAEEQSLYAYNYGDVTDIITSEIDAGNFTIEQKRNIAYTNYKNAIVNGEINSKVATDIQSSELLTAAQKEELIKGYNQQVIKGASNFVKSDESGAEADWTEEEAKEYLEEIEKDKNVTDETKNILRGIYEQKYDQELDGKLVNVYTDDISAFGNYSGSGDGLSKQTKYLKAIVRDAKAGKISKGDIIDANYGFDLTLLAGEGKYFVPSDRYEYMGNGIFRRVTGGSFVGEIKTIGKVYVPDGYKNVGGMITKD